MIEISAQTRARFEALLGPHKTAERIALLGGWSRAERGFRNLAGLRRERPAFGPGVPLLLCRTLRRRPRASNPASPTYGGKAKALSSRWTWNAAFAYGGLPLSKSTLAHSSCPSNSLDLYISAMVSASFFPPGRM